MCCAYKIILYNVTYLPLPLLVLLSQISVSKSFYQVTSYEQPTLSSLYKSAFIKISSQVIYSPNSKFFVKRCG